MVDTIVKLLDAITRFFAGIGWPLVCIIAVIWLAPALRDFISRINNVSGKIGGAEITLSAEQRDAANQIVAAKIDQVKNQNAAPQNPIVLTNQFNSFLKAALATTSKIQVANTNGKQLLWVDDNPNNNIYERQALSALGIVITPAQNTDAALALLKQQHFDVIISDMARAEGTTAGYDLLAKTQAADIKAPFIIYSASSNPTFVAEAKKRGAYGETSSPDVLVSLVTSALGATSAP